MTKKQLEVLKITHAWTHQPEHRDRLSPTLLRRLWFVLLSCLSFSITYSFSFPPYSSLFVKEGTTSVFPGGKSAVTGWGREPFSDGRGRTGKCLGDASKVLTLLLKPRNSLLVTLHSSVQEGCPFQRQHIDDKQPSHHHPPSARGHCKTSSPLSHVCLVGSAEILQITAEQLYYSS